MNKAAARLSAARLANALYAQICPKIYAQRNYRVYAYINRGLRAAKLVSRMRFATFLWAEITSRQLAKPSSVCFSQSIEPRL